MSDKKKRLGVRGLLAMLAPRRKKALPAPAEEEDANAVEKVEAPAVSNQESEELPEESAPDVELVEIGLIVKTRATDPVADAPVEITTLPAKDSGVKPVTLSGTTNAKGGCLLRGEKIKAFANTPFKVVVKGVTVLPIAELEVADSREVIRVTFDPKADLAAADDEFGADSDADADDAADSDDEAEDKGAGEFPKLVTVSFQILTFENEPLQGATVKQVDARNSAPRADAFGATSLGISFPSEKVSKIFVEVDCGLSYRSKRVTVTPASDGTTVVVKLEEYSILQKWVLPGVLVIVGVLVGVFFWFHPGVLSYTPTTSVVWGLGGFVVITLIFNSLRSVFALEWIDLLVPIFFAPCVKLFTVIVPPTGSLYVFLTQKFVASDDATKLGVFIGMGILVAMPLIVCSGFLIYAVLVQNNRRVLQQMPAYAAIGITLASNYQYNYLPSLMTQIFAVLFAIVLLTDLFKNYKDVFTGIGFGVILIFGSAALRQDGFSASQVQLAVLVSLVVLLIVVVALGIVKERVAGRESVERVTTGALDFIRFRIPALAFFTFYFGISVIQRMLQTMV